MKLSPKYLRFLKDKSKFHFLEGTTAAGKTTVGQVKFMLEVLNNEKTYHILSGLDLGTIEKNIINDDFGLLDIFGGELKYYSNGYRNIRLPHLRIRDKIIYVLGYDNVARWKKALGGQVGVLYIDEFNIADIEFVREAIGRCEYLIVTLNPDNPDLPIYNEYVNSSRPYEDLEYTYPSELLKQINGTAKDDWIHWYFTMEDNISMTEEDIIIKKSKYNPDTKIYKNKILGLRGRATGLVFNYDNKHWITAAEAKKYKYQFYSIGIDTSYSQKTDDTFALVFDGLTTCGKWIGLRSKCYNNKDLSKPITPSDFPLLLDSFIEENMAEFGFTREVFIDSADQGTILECKKWVIANGKSYNIWNAYKKTKIIDRINLQNGWMATGNFLVVREYNKEYEKEVNTYSWQEKKDIPEDGNDHIINGRQYAWLPYKEKIGKGS